MTPTDRHEPASVDTSPPPAPGDVARSTFEAMRPALESTLASIRGLAAAMGPAVHRLDPDPAPCRASDPAGYALWVRRNRNTGPPPKRGRGRGARR